MSTFLFNDNIISTSAQRGVTRYFNKIIDGAIASFGQEAIICSPQQRDYDAVQHFRSVRFPGSWRIGLQDKFATVVSAIKRPTVVYNAYYGQVNAKAHQVFTVYDMMHELFAPPTHPFIAQKRSCLKRATALLAISENTAKDIVTIYPDIDASKITVTPLGVDSFFLDNKTVQQSNQEKPYFLYVGHRTPYKNFLNLLIAFGQSGLSRAFDLKVISPSSDYTAEERDCLNQYQIQGQVQLLISPSDTALRDSYAQAYAFIYPSTYEGFGLPILEAMASGTMVATSNISSMPEIGGEIALYFDPHSVESIAACLYKMADLPTGERDLRLKQGVAHAKTFTWKRCQGQTLDVLQSLA